MFEPTAEGQLVYGPVPSRRLGLSLGVDLIPHKICCFDCVYCQVGRTTRKTMQRDEYVPAEEVVAQVRQWLATCDTPDYITMAGSGEPTLHSRLGWIIDQLRSLSDAPVALITNGALFGDPAVRAEAAKADLVMPSLDAGDERGFRYVNRPCESLTLAGLVDGLAQFRQEYTGKLWLEVFLLSGVTTREADARKISALAERIEPDRVLLNTAVRPTAESFAAAATEHEMRRVLDLFGPKAEIVVDFSHEGCQASGQVSTEMILATLRRRPSRLKDLATALGIHPDTAQRHLDALIAEGLVRPSGDQRGDYYEALSPGDPRA